MAMAPGTRLGNFEIVAPLGTGGMGEVYRARDTVLGRDVALKVLPGATASDPERLARFEREARTLASLNHPRVASIYGVEDGALVMELVEGPTLAERIAGGPLPPDEVLSLAGQIAEALEYAHERGIVHRDLKPANIKLTADGAIKVLDFGLAKALGEPATDSAAMMANSPTFLSHATEAGVILGTVAYMAPEQARGAKLDRRADIWSFGVVVYEMVTGRRLFDGATTSDVLAAVLRQEIAWDTVPAPWRRVLQRCLERDPKQRLRDIGDWHHLLDVPTPRAAAPLGVTGRSRGWWPVATVVLLVTTGWLGWVAWHRAAPAPRALVRLNVDLGPDLVGQTSRSPISGDLALATLSPDGSRLAFAVRTGDGDRQLATRLLSQDAVTLLPGTKGGSDPFFSPDGQWLAFFADNRLKKVPLQGGAVVTLCTLPSATDWQGGWWGDGDVIVAGLQFSGGLSRVPVEGGPPVPVTQLEPGREVAQRWPQVLPGGHAVLFSALPAPSVNFDVASIDVASLQTRERKTLVKGGYYGRYVPAGARSGYLVYLNGGAMFAAPFDPNRLELLGQPVRVVEGIARQAGLSVSASGAVIFPPSSPAQQTWKMAWLERNGAVTAITSSPGRYYTPRLSPDGRRLAFAMDRDGTSDVYVLDLNRGAMNRLTFSGQENGSPIWTPDGLHVVYRTAALAPDRGLRWIRADGAGEEHRLFEEGSTLMVPYSFSPDGRRLAYFAVDPTVATWQLWTVPIDASDSDRPKTRTPEVFARSQFRQLTPAFSPDGRWLAYLSSESGQDEVYVRPFPGPGGKWQISVGGGSFPIWSRGGRQLVFMSPDNRLAVSDITVKGDTLDVGPPRPWSTAEIFAPGRANFDVSADGTRAVVFTVPETPSGAGGLRVTLLLNFAEELRSRMSAP